MRTYIYIYTEYIDMHYLITYSIYNITKASNNMTADRFYLPWHATWCCVICLICTELHSKIIRYLSAVCHQTHPDLKAELIMRFHCYVSGVPMPPIPNCLAKSVEITKIPPFHSFSHLFPCYSFTPRRGTTWLDIASNQIKHLRKCQDG